MVPSTQNWNTVLWNRKIGRDPLTELNWEIMDPLLLKNWSIPDQIHLLKLISDRTRIYRILNISNRTEKIPDRYGPSVLHEFLLDTISQTLKWPYHTSFFLLAKSHQNAKRLLTNKTRSFKVYFRTHVLPVFLCRTSEFPSEFLVKKTDNFSLNFSDFS